MFLFLILRYDISQEEEQNDVASWFEEVESSMSRHSSLHLAVCSGMQQEATIALRMGVMDPDMCVHCSQDLEWRDSTEENVNNDGKRKDENGSSDRNGGDASPTHKPKNVSLSTVHKAIKDVAANIGGRCSESGRQNGLLQFVNAALGGWRPATHWMHHRGVQDAVHTVLLVSQRLRTEYLARLDDNNVTKYREESKGSGDAVAVIANKVSPSRLAFLTSRPASLTFPRCICGSKMKDAGPESAVKELNLPLMPDEMWRSILMFVLRRHHQPPPPLLSSPPL